MQPTESVVPEAPFPRPKPRGRKIVAWLSWIYALFVAAVWVFLRVEGDRSWLGAIAIFSPRWVVLLPLVPLMPLALIFGRRSLWILAGATAFAVLEIMGLCFPWRAALEPKDSALEIRILTCNLHHHAADPVRLSSLIAEIQPDIVALQEWMPPYSSSPIPTDMNWHVHITGEEFLATRFTILDSHQHSNHSATIYTLETPSGDIDLLNVHLFSPHLAILAALHDPSNGNEGLESNILMRQSAAEDLRELAARISNPLVIAGDFNLCPDSWIFRDNFGSLTDAFEASGFGFGYTYRVKHTSARIDHVLVNSRWICRDCSVGPDVGSPHHPLIADLSLRKGN